MITSSKNPKIQLIRRLLDQPKERREQGAFVVEGVRLAEEALQVGWEVRLALYSDALSERGQAVVAALAGRGAEMEQVPAALLRHASGTETPQGVVLVLAARTLPLPEAADFVLIADAVRDPGNLGAILRTAAAAGAQAVLLSGGTADAWAPKVLRSAMGAHFRLPVQALSWEAIGEYLKRLRQSAALQVFLADADGELAHTQADFGRPLALIIGGEAEGAGAQARALADHGVRIVMPGQAESLNAAVAAGVLMFEVVRQRSAEGER